jgi:hypothetical protein
MSVYPAVMQVIRPSMELRYERDCVNGGSQLCNSTYQTKVRCTAASIALRGGRIDGRKEDGSGNRLQHDTLNSILQVLRLTATVHECKHFRDVRSNYGISTIWADDVTCLLVLRKQYAERNDVYQLFEPKSYVPWRYDMLHSFD